MTGEPENHQGDRGILLAFNRNFITIPIASIVPLKTLPEGTLESRKFSQVLSSVRAIGLVEAPVVITGQGQSGAYFLLDGHLRIEVLKALGVTEVECLLATDDDTYTYNKRVNRIPPIQEHRMIARAMERGVSSADIAEALNLQVQTVVRRSRLLQGISEEAAELLKNTPCSIKIFDILRQMSAVRQIQAADLMTGQNNFTAMFARALLAATPDSQLVAMKKGKGAAAATPSGQQMARMERELAALQTQVKSVEDTYGIDTLHLTIIRGYVGKLLANPRISGWLAHNQPDYVSEFQRIAETENIAGAGEGIEH